MEKYIREKCWQYFRSYVKWFSAIKLSSKTVWCQLNSAAGFLWGNIDPLFSNVLLKKDTLLNNHLRCKHPEEMGLFISPHTSMMSCAGYTAHSNDMDAQQQALPSCQIVPLCEMAEHISPVIWFGENVALLLCWIRDLTIALLHSAWLLVGFAWLRNISKGPKSVFSLCSHLSLAAN